VVSFDDPMERGTMQKAKEAGKVRMEGKDYVMAAGDVMEFTPTCKFARLCRSGRSGPSRSAQTPGVTGSIQPFGGLSPDPSAASDPPVR
jgi:hypothetical protein